MNHCENSGLHLTTFPLASLIRWWDIQSFALGIVFGFFNLGLRRGSPSSPFMSSTLLEDWERDPSLHLLLEKTGAGFRALSKLAREGALVEVLESLSRWARGEAAARIFLRSVVAMDSSVWSVMMVVLHKMAVKGCVGGGLCRRSFFV